MPGTNSTLIETHQYTARLSVLNDAAQTKTLDEIKKEYADFIANLCELANAETFQEILQIQNNRRDTLLHTVLYSGYKETVKALLAKIIKYKLIDEVLPKENIVGATLLNMLASRPDYTEELEIILKTKTSATNKALLTLTQQGNSVLDIAIQRKNEKAFELLIENASEETINELIIANTTQNNNEKVNEEYRGHTPLHMALYVNDNNAIKTILKKSRTETINQALKSQDKQGNTPLHLALIEKNHTAFELLIQEASLETMSILIFIQNQDGDTLLHTVIKQDNIKALQLMLQKTSQTALKAASLIKNNAGDTSLHTAIKKENTVSLKLILEISVIETAAFITNENNDMPLHMAAKQKNTKTFDLIANKISLKTFNSVVITKGSSDNTLLHIALLSNNTAVILLILEKGSAITIDTVLSMKNSYNETPLEIASRLHNIYHLKLLLEKSSKETARKSLTQFKTNSEMLLNNLMHFNKFDILELFFEKNLEENSNSSRSPHSKIRKLWELLKEYIKYRIPTRGNKDSIFHLSLMIFTESHCLNDDALERRCLQIVKPLTPSPGDQILNFLSNPNAVHEEERLYKQIKSLFTTVLYMNDDGDEDFVTITHLSTTDGNEYKNAPAPGAQIPRFKPNSS